MEITTVGIDIGKTWFHLVGCNRAGSPLIRHRLNRGKLALFIAKLPRCLIGMEACPGSQYLARVFQRHGHDVRLIAPKFIKPYLKGQKNDVMMQRRSPRQSAGRRCASSLSNRTSSSTCKPFIAFVIS